MKQDFLLEAFISIMLLAMPNIVNSAQAEEVEIPLQEESSMGAISSTGPVDDPEQSGNDPTRPNDFRATISGNSLTIANQNNSILSVQAVVMNVSTGGIVFNQLFTTSLVQQIASSGEYVLYIGTANGTLSGHFVVQYSLLAQDYYWYNGEKIPLLRGDQQYFIFEDDLLNESDKSQIMESGDVFYSEAPNLKWGVTKPDAVIEDMEHVLYQVCSYVDEHNRHFFITHRFYVKLKSTDDVPVLQNIVSQYHAEIEKEDPDLPLWYILRWGLQAQYNALELANIFYESGLFEAAEPEFMGALNPDNEESIPIIGEHSSVAKKIMQNGILVIEQEGKKYNAQGIEIN